jgi:superfamily II DNA/RNA helicase
MTFPEKIYNLNRLQNDLVKIIKYSVTNLFPILNRGQKEISYPIDWNNLLMCASAMSHSDNPDCQDAALRIAQCCLTRPEATKIQRVASSIIFNKLTNRPAIDLALEKDFLPQTYRDEIPLPFKIENAKRDIKHSIYIKNNEKPIYLNKFQSNFYEKAHEVDYVSASAPTSSGKSFILNTFVLEQLADKDNPKNVIYLVPTRALINQIEQDFRSQLSDDVYLSSIPQLPNNEDRKKPNLLIFTQERMHWFMSENLDYKVDILIVDEAQKIGDGGRGVLLQQKIEELIETSPSVKILFCSPFSQNPEILLEGLPESKSRAIILTEYVAVNQNLIWISKSKGHPKQWKIDLCLKNNTINLGNIEIKKNIGEKEKLPQFCYLLGSTDGGNMIYVNGQADAEDVAAQIFDMIPIEEKDEKINELIDITKKLIHPEYLLSKVLEKKIAFHYGNMPLVIRKEIEKLFSDGHIKYLVCTSTLLEGVNLPAKSIFIRKPKRSQKLPMSESDFWNLAGRAGRLKKEFQGNIICIDPEEWDNKPIKKKTKHYIKKAVTEISEDKKGLLDYIREVPGINFQPNLEYIFSYYFTKFIKEGSLKKNLTDEVFTKELEDEFKKIKKTIEIPDKILYRNPGISPISQQKLLDYFRNYDDDINNLIPPSIDNEGKAYGGYIAMVKRINKILSKDNEALAPYHTILIMNWINGYPLSRIIKSNIKYWEKNNSSKKISTIIRSTMADIEEFVRFKFAKYSSCYIDILKYYLKEKHEHLIDSVPQLNMWIEFGVSQKTQISLINLGLSRHTAIELSEYIGESNYTKEECIEWLLKTNIFLFDMPKIAQKEISALKDYFSKK